MKNAKYILFVVLLVWITPAVGQNSKKDAEPSVLFAISGNPVSVVEFIHLYKKNHSKPEDFTEQKINEYVSLFVNFKLKVTEAKAMGMDTTAVFIKEYKTYKDELKKPFTAEKSELDKLVKLEYQRMGEEVRASHILIAVKQDAVAADTIAAFKKIMTIRDKILGGETFDKAASEFSEDPSAKTNHGDLGYFSALQMVYQFEDAAYALKVGEISQPIRTRFGYHILKVVDRKPARGEVEVSHILLRTGTGDDSRVKNKIFEIDEQLQGGRSWDELCKEYSDDPGTKDKGGRLKPFGVGAFPGVPEFEATAFSLRKPGEISDPFKSAYGWHIIRLEKKISLAPFKEMEPVLQRKLGRDERLQEVNKRLTEEKKKSFHFVENPETLKTILAHADTSLQKGTWKFKGDGATKSLTLFTIDGKKYTAGSFISFVEKSQMANVQSPASYMIMLYKNFETDKLNDAEEDRLMMKNPEFRSLATEYKEGILLFSIMEKEVWNKASLDTAGLRAFYKANTQKYKAGDRVKAAVYSSNDKGFLDDILAKVERGDSIPKESAKQFKSIVPFRNYERGESKAIDKVQWTIGTRITEVDGTYYLVAIDNLVAPGPKSFEESKAQVISDYQDDIERKWMERLRQKYPVKINNKGKKYVINDLVKK